MSFLLRIPLLAILLIAAPILAQTLPGHSFHGEAFDDGPRQAAYLMTGTGNVQFKADTTNEQVQIFINQGVGQLHGFWYFEAERSFRQAAALDPACAIAYWGMALANTNNEKRALLFIAEAVKRKDHADARQKLYIEAYESYLKSGPANKKTRGPQYAAALEQIAQRYPDDIEARAFLGLQLWQNSRDGNPIQSNLAVDALLKQVLAVEPLHPCHHYLIHMWDSAKPDMALPSAARCGQGSPAIAHMWHMPGHIYSKLKRYDDAVYQQEASTRVDHAHMMRDRILPDQIHNFAHNNEWLIRNLNNLGQVRHALDLATNMIELPRHPRYNDYTRRGSASYGRHRLFETLARFELWPQLLTLADTAYLEPTDVAAEQARRRRYIGRAALALGDTAKTKSQIAALEKLLAEQKDKPQPKNKRPNSESKSSEPKTSDSTISDSKAPTPDTGGGTLVPPSQTPAPATATAGEKPEPPARTQIEQALNELRGLIALSKGDAKAALADLRKAGDAVDPMFIYDLEFQTGQARTAEDNARRHLKTHGNEVQPQARFVELLWKMNKKSEAAKAFEDLRKMSVGVDSLTYPPFARLAPIAAELKLPADWRIARAPSTNVGDRPSLDALGPYRYSPYAAPDFHLRGPAGLEKTLADYRGKPLILIFFLGGKCLHCMQQLQAFIPAIEKFEKAGFNVAAISTDDMEGIEKLGRDFPDGHYPMTLLSDRSMAAFKSFRCYDDFEKLPLHGTFVIDAAGKVRWQDISFDPFMDPAFVLKEAQRLLNHDRVKEQTPNLITATH